MGGGVYVEWKSAKKRGLLLTCYLMDRWYLAGVGVMTDAYGQLSASHARCGDIDYLHLILYHTPFIHVVF